jgi:hypothetical protein
MHSHLIQPTPPFLVHRLYNLVPPAAGNYHLQFEFGLAAAGTPLYLDDVQAGRVTQCFGFNRRPGDMLAD